MALEQRFEDSDDEDATLLDDLCDSIEEAVGHEDFPAYALIAAGALAVATPYILAPAVIGIGLGYLIAEATDEDDEDE